MVTLHVALDPLRVAVTKAANSSEKRVPSNVSASALHWMTSPGRTGDAILIVKLKTNLPVVADAGSISSGVSTGLAGIGLNAPLRGSRYPKMPAAEPLGPAGWLQAGAASATIG